MCHCIAHVLPPHAHSGTCCRFYEPQSGNIYLNGRPVSDFSRGEWAKAVAMVRGPHAADEPPLSQAGAGHIFCGGPDAFCQLVGTAALGKKLFAMALLPRFCPFLHGMGQALISRDCLAERRNETTQKGKQALQACHLGCASCSASAMKRPHL